MARIKNNNFRHFKSTKFNLKHTLKVKATSLKLSVRQTKKKKIFIRNPLKIDSKLFVKLTKKEKRKKIINFSFFSFVIFRRAHLSQSLLHPCCRQAIKINVSYINKLQFKFFSLFYSCTCKNKFNRR